MSTAAVADVHHFSGDELIASICNDIERQRGRAPLTQCVARAIDTALENVLLDTSNAEYLRLHRAILNSAVAAATTTTAAQKSIGGPRQSDVAKLSTLDRPVFKLTFTGAGATSDGGSYDPPVEFVFDSRDANKARAIDTQQSEDTVTVLLESTGAAQAQVPVRGAWHMSMTGGNADVLTRVGNYDFRFANEAAKKRSGVTPDHVDNWMLAMRVKLFDVDTLKRGAISGAGVSEMELTVRMLDNGHVIIERAALRLFLRIDDRWYSQSHTTVARVPTVDTVPSTYEDMSPVVVKRSNSEQPSSSSSAQQDDSRPTSLVFPVAPTYQPSTAATKQVRSNFQDLLFGRDASYVSSFVVMGINDQVTHEEGASDTLCRLGSGSATPSAVALASYYRDTKPRTAEHGVRSELDLHSEQLTRAYFEDAGASHMYKALQACYETQGFSAPTLAQLLSGRSGLPAEIPADLLQVQSALATATAVSSSANNKAIAGAVVDDDDDNSGGAYFADSRRIERALRTQVVPLFEPGTRAVESPLAFALLRCTVRGWQDSNAPEQAVERTLRELGMNSATFEPRQEQKVSAMVSQQQRINASAGASSEPELVRDSATSSQGAYSLACGLYATPRDLARFYSDRAPWYVALAGQRKINAPRAAVNSDALATRYGFMTAMMQPHSTIDKASEVYSSYNLVHTNVDYHDKPLRALIKIGHVQGAHTTISASVPALHVSTVFSTNATPDDIARQVKGDWPAFYSHMVGYALDHVGGEQMVYDRVAEHLLSFKPAEHQQYVRTLAHSRDEASVSRTFESADVAVQLVGSGLVNRKLVSLAEALAGVAQPPTLCIEQVPASELYARSLQQQQQQQNNNKAATTVALVLRTSDMGGATPATLPLVYDRVSMNPVLMANDSNAARRGGSASERVGALRVLDSPSARLLGEYVSLATLVVNDQMGNAPCVAYRGRVYCEPVVVDAVRTGHLARAYQDVASSAASVEQLRTELNEQLNHGAAGTTSAILGGAASQSLMRLYASPQQQASGDVSLALYQQHQQQQQQQMGVEMRHIEAHPGPRRRWPHGYRRWRQSHYYPGAVSSVLAGTLAGLLAPTIPRAPAVVYYAPPPPPPVAPYYFPGYY